MKGLHSFLPPFRYAWAPYLTNELYDANQHQGEMRGSILDRWAEDKKCYGLWRWDRDEDSNGVSYIIRIPEDDFYFQYEDRYIREFDAMVQHHREMALEGTNSDMAWWANGTYIADPEQRPADIEVHGAEEMTYETVQNIPRPDPKDLNWECNEYGHDWEYQDGGQVCLRCEVDREPDL